MKIRCIDDLGMTALEVGRFYEGELKFNHWYKEKRWYLEGEKFRKFCFSEKAFEIVREDNKMQEKTFREVISMIKEGEVWESENNSCDIRIKKDSTGISIRDFKDNALVFFSDSWKFKLQRKQYTFEEAFKAYKNGKVIESCVTGDKYTWNGLTDLICKNGSDGYSKLKSIYIEEIKGKWYINN